MLSLRNPTLALVTVFLLAGTTAESYAQTRWHQMDVVLFSAPPSPGSEGAWRVLPTRGSRSGLEESLARLSVSIPSS